ncbi:MAG TPA: phosphate ABC transporter permease subunit PstC [Acidimicrobiales bacterium]|nr:phosphate ABC transporter permease subunit PstC [Acidimicrobiales bacterium]
MTAPLSVGDLRGDPRRVRKEAIVRTLFLGAACLSVVVSAGIVVALVGRAWSFVTEVDTGSLWGDNWNPRGEEFSIKALMSGTLLVTAIGMAIATPVGMGSAIYLSEYASPRVRRTLKPILEVLAGIPSVVLGFFCVSFVSPTIVKNLSSDAGTFSLVSAGIGVGILTVPLIASVAEDAMRSVPAALREASYGLGARKITTSIRVVLPAAVSGLVAAFILAVSRAVGETMVVLLAAGSANRSQFTVNPFEEGLTMTAAIASQVRGSDAAVSQVVVDSLYFVGFVLFAVTLLLNVVADRFVRRVRQAY